MANTHFQTHGYGFFFHEEAKNVRTRMLRHFLKISPTTLDKVQGKAPVLMPFLERNIGYAPIEAFFDIMQGYDCDYTSCTGLAVLFADLENEHTGLNLIVLEDEERGPAIIRPDGAPWEFNDVEQNLDSVEDLRFALDLFSGWIADFNPSCIDRITVTNDN